MGHKADKADGKTTVIKTRPAQASVPMAQALEDLDNAQAVADDLIALNGG